MVNTYNNKTILLTAIVLAIAMPTSLNAAYVAAGEEKILVQDELITLTEKTFYIPQIPCSFELPEVPGEDKGGNPYTFAKKSRSNEYVVLPFTAKNGLYSTETSTTHDMPTKVEANLGIISQSQDNYLNVHIKRQYTYTPPETTKDSTFEFLYYYTDTDKKTFYGKLTFNVSPKAATTNGDIDNSAALQILADRVKQLESNTQAEVETLRKENMQLLIKHAVSKENRAHMREIHQLYLNQAELAGRIQQIKHELDIMTNQLSNQIDELTPQTGSFCEWFRALWS